MHMHSCSDYSSILYIHVVVAELHGLGNYFVGRSTCTCIYLVICVLDKVLVNRTCTTLLLRKFQNIDLHELSFTFTYIPSEFFH